MNEMNCQINVEQFGIVLQPVINFECTSESEQKVDDDIDAYYDETLKINIFVRRFKMRLYDTKFEQNLVCEKFRIKILRIYFV